MMLKSVPRDRWKRERERGGGGGGQTTDLLFFLIIFIVAVHVNEFSFSLALTNSALSTL